MAERDYNVYKTNTGWAAKRQGASRAGFTGDTQAGVYNQVRDSLAGSDGGEISVHGVDGKIRDKNTIKPAHDPRDIKG